MNLDASTPTKTTMIKEEETIQFKTTSRISPYPYACVYILPLLSFLCTYNQGPLLNLLVPAILLLLLPGLELVLGMDNYNPSKDESKHLENLFSFRLITWLWVPLQIFLISATCILLWQQNSSLMNAIFVAISVGIVTGGIGITVAHELIHKNSIFEQYLGKILLGSVMYLHFYPEHLMGHHKRVATKEDPATSRYGETVYEFLPRSIIFSYLSAWKIEAKRMQKQNYPIVSWNNVMIQEIIISITTITLLSLILGKIVTLFWVLQSFVAIIMLEVINYVEHYGLQRKEKDGRYERVTPFHSWNADHWASNYVLFKLQRHADHHTWPYRRYQTLRHWDFSPQLPTGYAGMFLLALFPPLFFSVMNPKVQKFNNFYHHSGPEIDQ